MPLAARGRDWAVLRRAMMDVSIIYVMMYKVEM